MSTYEPGTVAVATVRGVEGVRVMRTNGIGGADAFWVSAEFVGHRRSHEERHVADVRPLVLLDPHPEGSVGDKNLRIQNVLRTLRGSRYIVCEEWANQIEAQTRPARIPEPGLWGVVEAAALDRGSYVWQWVHHPHDVWLNAEGESAKWGVLIDPVLIREGVES